MKQAELVERIMAKAKIKNKSAAKRALKTVVSSVTDSLKAGNKITIAGLGTFKVRETKSRRGRNPKTGESIQIPASKRVSFKPAGSLKRAIREYYLKGGEV